jgi:HlyD family secretion protein
MNVRTFILTGIIALSLTTGCKGNRAEYRMDIVSRGDIRESVTATGIVNPVTTVLVGTQVSGTIKSIFVDFNSPVKKGQVIAQIDPQTFEAQVEQARANVARAEAQAKDAERTLTRSRQLFSRNLIARSELDTAETNNDSNAAQLIQARAALRMAETNLQYTRILSPVDGVVISRNVDVGQTVAASFQTPTLFSISQDLTKMQINTSVDEADIGKVKVGQETEFTVDAFPDETFEGAVWQVRNAPTTVQNVVTYDVVVKVPNLEKKLKPGMTANVSIITAEKKNVLRVPNAALRFKLAEQGRASLPQKGQGVWVLEKGDPKRVPVTTGSSDGILTEVLSGELTENQQVIVESAKTKNSPQRPSGPRMF